MNEQKLVIYNKDTSGGSKTIAYTTAYSGQQAEAAVEACTARHGTQGNPRIVEIEEGKLKSV